MSTSGAGDRGPGASKAGPELDPPPV